MAKTLGMPTEETGVGGCSLVVIICLSVWKAGGPPAARPAERTAAALAWAGAAAAASAPSNYLAVARLKASASMIGIALLSPSTTTPAT